MYLSNNFNRSPINYGNIPECPCRHCSERNATCHSTCKKYLNWSKIQREITYKKQQEIKQDNEQIIYIQDAHQMELKRYGKR